jgi:hypothetical protein
VLISPVVLLTTDSGIFVAVSNKIPLRLNLVVTPRVEIVIAFVPLMSMSKPEFSKASPVNGACPG